MNKIRMAIRKIGIPVTLYHHDSVRQGAAVLYPVRYQQKSFGNMLHTPEGRTDGGRYMLFAEKELLEEAAYGDIIEDGTQRYMILWRDHYGFYAKACMKPLTEGV